MSGIAACVPLTGMRQVGCAVAGIWAGAQRAIAESMGPSLGKRQSCLHRKTACCLCFTLPRLYLAPKPEELVITALFPLFPRVKQLLAVQAVCVVARSYGSALGQTIHFDV